MRKSGFAIVASAAVFVAAMASLGTPAFAGADVFVFPVAFVETSCSGEEISVQGSWQVTVNVHEDRHGGFHVVDNWNIHADGEGSYGNRYRMN